MVTFDVDARDLERLGRDVGGVDDDLGIRHRGDYRQAAVAGAEIEDAARAVGKPRVERPGLLDVDEQLGDVRARNDRALVDRERDVLQPRLAGEIGGGLAGLDPSRDQVFDLRLVGGFDRAPALRLERIERQAERPGDEPRGLVERVAGAVAERDAGAFQSLRCGDDELDQRHRRASDRQRTSCSSVAP